MTFGKYKFRVSTLRCKNVGIQRHAKYEIEENLSLQTEGFVRRFLASPSDLQIIRDLPLIFRASFVRFSFTLSRLNSVLVNSSNNFILYRFNLRTHLFADVCQCGEENKPRLISNPSDYLRLD